MRYMMLIAVLSTLLMAGFVKVGETVEERSSGLVWQDDHAVEEKELLYDEAKVYCESLSLAGSSDWRLPTLYELQSIVDLTRYDPALQRGFHFGLSKNYWSITPYADDETRAWAVDFKSGSTEHSRHSYDYYVRCVRDMK